MLMIIHIENNIGGSVCGSHAQRTIKREREEFWNRGSNLKRWRQKRKPFKVNGSRLVWGE